MKTDYPRLSLAICLSAALLGGCAWASRNIYREPAAGDVGTITLLLRAPGYRSNVWVSYNPTVPGDPKAMSVFDDTTSKTVKAVHKDKVVLSVEITRSGFVGAQITSEKCGKAYEVPFATGDLRVTLASTGSGCAFRFERRGSPGQPWEAIDQVPEWKQQLLIK